MTLAKRMKDYMDFTVALGFHSKTLCRGTLDAEPKGELNHYAVSELRVFSWREGICIGGLICNDMWANPECTPMPDPHLSQQLSSIGTDIIFHAVNGGRSGGGASELAWRYNESNLRMRARARKLWVVTIDNSTPKELPCSSPSGVIDRSGTFVCRAESKEEQLFVKTITLKHDQQEAEGDG